MKHVSGLKNLLTCSKTAEILIRLAVKVQSLEIGQLVVERNAQGRKKEVIIDLDLIGVAGGVQLLLQHLHVLQGIGVEEVKLALPKDRCHVGVKFSLDLQHFLLSFSAAEFFHDNVDVVACVVSIGPLLKLEGKLELLLTHLEDLGHLCLGIKSDGVWNLCTCGSSSLNFNHFIVFDDLIKVVMECFTNFSELLASIVLPAEVEYFPGGVVVEL